MAGVSDPRPLEEPSWLRTGTEFGAPGDSMCASEENTAVVASMPVTGTISRGAILKSTRLLPWNAGENDLVTHLVGLSELESISIDDGEGARDKWKREENLPLKDPANLRMRLASGCFLLAMMIVSEKVYEFGSHGKLFRDVCFIHPMMETTANLKAPLTSAVRVLYSLGFRPRQDMSPNHSRASTLRLLLNWEKQEKDRKSVV